MTVVRAFLLSLIALVGVSAPANAQPSIYTMKTEPAHGREVKPSQAGVHAQQVMIEFGRCVLKRYPQYVTRFLSQLPGTPRGEKAASALATSECIEGGVLSFQSALLRGALFEAMYDRAKPLKLLSGVAALPEQVDYRPGSVDPSAPGLPDFIALRMYGDCVVRADPIATDRILSALPGSLEEGAAFGYVSPSLGSCLSKGAQLKFSKIILRGILAEAAYRLSNPGPEQIAAGK